MAKKVVSDINSCITNGIDPLPCVEKLQSLVKQCNQWTDVESLCQQLIHVLIRSASQPKVARRLAKVVSDMEAEYVDIVKTQITDHLDCSITNTTTATKDIISTWSQLLECSDCARELMRDDIIPLLKVVDEPLRLLVSWNKVWTSEVQDNLQMYVKVSLQVCQHLSSTVGTLVWNASEAKKQQTGQVLLQDILSQLLNILSLDIVYKDTRRLAATVFGYILLLSAEPQCIIETFVKLLEDYKSGSLIQIGELNLSTVQIDAGLTYKHSDYGHLCLINGFLACCSTPIFMADIPIASPEIQQKLQEGTVHHKKEMGTNTVAQFLFQLIHKHCHSTNNSYHAFKTLLLCFQKVQKSGSVTLSVPVFKYIAEQTLSLVWTNLDSPVDGVSETVMEIFHIFVELTAKYKCELEDLLHHVMGHVMQMSWQVKGKYTVCAILLPHTDVDKVKLIPVSDLFIHSDVTIFLERYNDSWSELLRCMSTNYMAPAATEMYKAITNATLRISPDKWKLMCLPWLVKGITHHDTLSCYNVCHLWLPWTLKMIPDSYKWLLQELGHLAKPQQKPDGSDQKVEEKPWNSLLTKREQEEQELRATVSVCMVARKLQIIKLDNIPEKIVMQALLHSNDDLRLDAFALVCNSPKKSECVSEVEINLLKASLPHAMTSDTPPFRQQLQAHLRALVVRLRDGALACVRELKHQKSPKKKKEELPETVTQPLPNVEVERQLDQQLDLLEWLWNLCVSSLQPSSSFQRLKTSLECIWIILDSTVYQPDRKRRKGGCPESCRHLLDMAKDQRKLSLFTSDTTQALLTCVMDGTDDIRELSCNILNNYFPSPLHLGPEDFSKDVDDSSDTLLTPKEVSSVCSLLQTAFTKCWQPRAHDAHAGALLSKIVYQRYVLDAGWLFQCDGENQITVIVPNNEPNQTDSCMAFFNLLVNHLEKCMKVSSDDMLMAAQRNPTHGTLMALQQCLSLTTISKPELWRPLVEKIITTTDKLVEVALNILGGKLHQDGSAPSFEQMGLSIQTVIEESLGEESLQEDVILSTDHQLLMTWAWLNIRETSTLYGKLVTLPLTTTQSPGVLTVNQVQRLGDLVVNILTRCRHRGAIEGSSLGLMHYCSHLLHSKSPELHAIPGKLVERAIDQVLEASATSVTRRSAGLPLIVLAVLTSETKTKQSGILSFAVNKLLSIIEMPLPPATDQRLDLPHVHAYNILKRLFSEASISASMMQFIEKACKLAVEGFSSPVWALRNSATQLFSTLQNRILGQKKTKDDSLHTTTLEELFSHFPTLKPFLLGQLQKAAAEHEKGGLHPSLFPVLAILSKLSPGVVLLDHDSDMTGYLEAVHSLAASPMYAVRELSSHALVPLVAPDNMDQYALELALDMPTSRETCKSFNTLHGRLFQIKALLTCIQSRHEEGNAEEHLRQVLTERHWLCSSDNPCHIVKACYIQLMKQLCWTSGNIQDLITEIVPSTVHNSVGDCQLIKVVLQHWLDTDTVCHRVEKCLQSESADVQMVCIQMIKHKLKFKEIGMHEVGKLQVLLLNFLRDDLTWELLCDCLNCIIVLHKSIQDQKIESPVCRQWERLLSGLILQRSGSEPAALAMTVFSILIKSHSSVTASVKDWVNMIHQGADPAGSESMRYQSAQSLYLMGANVFNLLLDTENRSTNNELMALRLLRSTVHLLTDEQCDVRNIAASFVTQLPWIPASSIFGKNTHPNYSLELLFQHVLAELSESPVCMRELFMWMLPGQPAHLVLENEISGNSDLFEAQEVNPYSENHVLYLHISVFFWKQKNVLCPSFGGQDISDITEQLQLCVTCLQNNSHSVLGITCNRVVYGAILCLIYRIQVLLTVMSADKKASVRGQLHLLCQVPGIHGNLKKLAEVCKKMCS